MKGYPANMERHTTHTYEARCAGCELIAKMDTPVPPDGWATLVPSRETREVPGDEWADPPQDDQPRVIFDPIYGVKLNYCQSCARALEVP